MHAGLVHSEEVVGQKLLDLEGQKSQMMRELEKVEREVQQSLAKSHTLDSEIQYPSVLTLFFAAMSFLSTQQGATYTSNDLCFSS